jgi:hypothetical protein
MGGQSELDRGIPSSASKRLIKLVRGCLNRYGIRPVWNQLDVWHDAWRWADQIAESYRIPFGGRLSRRKHFPSSYEIGSMYVALLLVKMRKERDFKLPFRARDHMPSQVQQRLLDLGDAEKQRRRITQTQGLEEESADMVPLLGRSRRS